MNRQFPAKMMKHETPSTVYQTMESIDFSSLTTAVQMSRISPLKHHIFLLNFGAVEIIRLFVFTSAFRVGIE